MSILEKTAVELKASILSGEISASELLEMYIENIEASNANAFISTRFDEARAEAKAVDEKIAKGETVGSLGGLPIALKDNIVIKGGITTCGSKMLENFNSPYDSTVFEKIREADGIVIGKTNMDEFAMGSTTRNSYYGVTLNPLDESLVPGGSSGGSAAAVAGVLAPLAIGTDTGGSVRQPASFCGVVGIKPSYGSISRSGVVTMANTLDTVGTFGRDVRDAALMLETLFGLDVKDGTTFENPLDLDFEFTVGEYLKDIKIAIPKYYLEIELEDEVKDEFDKAIEILKENGATVDVVDMDYVKYSTEVYHILANSEISSNMSRFDGIRFGYRSENYADIDELYRATRTEAFGDEVKKRIMIGTHIMSFDDSNEYYKKAQKIRTLIIEDYKKIFAEYDFVMSPTSSVLPFAIDSDISNVEIYKSDLFTTSVNIFGGCGISVPMPSLESGLSVGIHFVGDVLADSKLIKMAYAFERVVR